MSIPTAKKILKLKLKKYHAGKPVATANNKIKTYIILLPFLVKIIKKKYSEQNLL